MPESTEQHFHLESSAADRGKRLDQFLQAHLSQWSRSRIQQWIQGGEVTLEGKRAKASQILKGGEKISVTIPPPQKLELEAQNIPLEVPYEDEDLLVVDKPAELVVHPGAGQHSGTLVHALLYHCRDLSGIGGKLRPGIVHRLDKGTSGLLLVAKNDFAHRKLSEAFKNRKIEKTYSALVWGVPQPRRGKIELALGRDPKDRKKISSRASRTREATTRYEVLKEWGPVSLLELHPETGRTHQIRVHLAEAGYPVVGDPLYGKGRRRFDALPQKLQQCLRPLPFQLLHAGRLVLEHPRSGKKMDIHAEMRPEMKQIIELLDHRVGEGR